MAVKTDTYGLDFVFNGQDSVKTISRLGTASSRATDKLKDMVTQKGYLLYSMKRIVAYSAIFTFFGSLVKMLGDVVSLELALAEVNTLIDKTNQDAVRSFNEVTEALLRLDPHLGDAINLTKGLYEIISAGVTDPTQAFKLLVVSAKYAKVGLTDLATAASSLTAVMKAYGFTAEAMRGKSDVLFAAVREGKFHTDELNEAIGKVLPTAAAMSVSVEEISAALAIMTQRGLDVNEAATSLNRMLITFLRPMDKAKKEFKKLGWQWGRNAFEGIGLIGVMQRLETAGKRYGELLPTIFRRQRALRGAFILQGEGLRDLVAMYERIKEATVGSGIVAAEYGRITKTVSEQLKALYANLIQAFSVLLKHKGVAASFIKQLSELLRVLVENVPAIMAVAAAVLILKKVMLLLNTQVVRNIISQVLYRRMVRAFNVAMVDSIAVQKAAIVTAKAWQAAIMRISIYLTIALGTYLLVKGAIDKKNKATDEAIARMYRHAEVQKNVNQALETAARVWKSLTGETLKYKKVVEEMAFERVIEDLKKISGAAGEKSKKQIKAITAALKETGYAAWENRDAFKALLNIIWSKEATPENLRDAKEILRHLAIEWEHLEREAHKYVKTLKESSPEFKRALTEMSQDTLKLARDLRSVGAEIKSLPRDLAERFTAPELGDMLKALDRLKAGIDPLVLDQLAAFGVDTKKLLEDTKGLDAFREALTRAIKAAPGVHYRREVEDLTRAYAASIKELVYTQLQAKKAGEAMHQAWKERSDVSLEAQKAWATSNRKEIDKIMNSGQQLTAATRRFLESRQAMYAKDVNKMEKIREKLKKISEKTFTDREKISSKIIQLQNEYNDEQHKNILQQFEREKMAYEKRARERYDLAIKAGGDLLSAAIEYQQSMLKIQELGEESQRVSQYRGLKKRLDEFKKTLNSMRQNTQQRIDTTYEMEAAATEFLRNMGIADEKFMEILATAIREYFKKIREETEAGRDVMQEYIKYFRSLARSLSFISDTFTELADSMNMQQGALRDLAHLFDITADAVDGFAKGLKSIEDSKALTGLAATVGKIAGVLAIAVAGFKLGWELGKFLKGLFGGDIRTAEEKAADAAVKKLERFVAKLTMQLKDLGRISEDVAKKIYELVGKGIPEHVAVSMSLVDLMNDTGLSLKNFEGYLTRMIEALGTGTTSLWDMEEAAEVVGETFSRLIEYAKKMGLEGHRAILDLIRRAKELGYEIKEINDYIKQNLEMAAEGLAKMIKWVAADAVDAWNAMKDLRKEKRKLMNEMAKYQRQMDRLKEGSEAWVEAKEKVEDLYNQILKLDKQLGKHQSVLEQVSNATVKQLKRLGLLTASVFSAMVAEGVPMWEVFAKMSEAVFALMDRYKALGLEVPKYLRAMFKQFKAFRKMPEFFEGLEGLLATLQGLGNSGFLTAEAFKAIFQEAKRYFDLLRKSKDLGGLGLGDEASIRAMYPLLQQMWWYAQQYDMKLPKWLKDAIKEAKGLGLKFEKPVLERQLDAIDRLNDRMIWHRKGLRDPLLDIKGLLGDIKGRGDFQHGTRSAPGGLAFLHRGEAVLPESMTSALKRFFVGGGGIGGEGSGGMVEAHIYVDGEKTYKALVPYIRKGGAYADFELDGIGVR